MGISLSEVLDITYSNRVEDDQMDLRCHLILKVDNNYKPNYC